MLLISGTGCTVTSTIHFVILRYFWFITSERAIEEQRCGAHMLHLAHSKGGIPLIVSSSNGGVQVSLTFGR